jgi:hypothetical protein
LSFEDETDRRRRPESSPASETHDLPSSKKKKRAPNAEVGHALRSAYRQAVEEDIPPELLDLLGKLG